MDRAIALEPGYTESYYEREMVHIEMGQYPEAIEDLDQATDDNGVRPAVLAVFDGDIAASHCLRVLGNEMVGTKVNVPVQVAYESALKLLRPLRGALQSAGH